MHSMKLVFFIAFCSLTTVICEPQTLAVEADNEIDDNDAMMHNLEKRLERYAFGLGRRAYTYTSGGASGVKRLPVYNFGLGKRARPYSFGLGKRNDYSENDYQDVENNLNKNDNDRLIDAYIYENMKRNRPYSFGLGKRSIHAEHDRLKRDAPPYDFGMGKHSIAKRSSSR